MKKLLLILASVLAFNAHAATIDESNLTEDQKAQVAKIVAAQQERTNKELVAIDAVKKASNLSATARVETEKWAELGGNMGKAAVGAAKEIGMAANEFVGTPLGKVTMAVVVYKVVGRDIIRAVLASTIMVFFAGMTIAMFRSKKYKNIKYEFKPYLFGLWNRRVVVEGYVDDDWSIGYLICTFIMAVIGLVVGLSVMP